MRVREVAVALSLLALSPFPLAAKVLLVETGVASGPNQFFGFFYGLPQGSGPLQADIFFSRAPDLFYAEATGESKRSYVCIYPGSGGEVPCGGNEQPINEAFSGSGRHYSLTYQSVTVDDPPFTPEQIASGQFHQRTIGYDFYGAVRAEGFNSGPPIAYRLVIRDSSVPEPATWSLIIAGFGAAGAAARQRRSVKLLRRMGA